MFKKENISFEIKATNKAQLIDAITKKAKQLNVTNDEKQLAKDLMTREEQSSTGFTDGIAIPHTQSSAVITPTILVLKTSEAIDYDSMDQNPSQLFIAILVPKDSGSEHLRILQLLTRKMVDPKFINEITTENSQDKLFDLITSALEDKENTASEVMQKREKKNIVAVCACPMGLAHTFMAAEVIENYAKKYGHDFKIETQGADGIQNYLSKADIANADIIIHAIAVTPQDFERFEGHVINEIGLQELIKNPEPIIDGFMNNQDTKTEVKIEDTKSVKNTLWVELSKHLMSGISYMIPILVMGGLLGAIALLIPYSLMGIDADMSIQAALETGLYTGFSETILLFCHVVQGFGFTLFGFAIPVFAAFCAYSIGGKSAWPIGFIGGYVAINPTSVAIMENGKFIENTPVASGFFGAVIIAFFAGYLVKFLNRKIQLPHTWLAFKTTFLIPLIAAFSCMLLMVYAITPLGGMINSSIETVLIAAGQTGEMMYSVLLAGATAFDLGGPVNKAAGFVALGFATDELLPITARCIAIVVPSIGLGLSTVIDKRLVGRRVYDAQFKQVGQTSIFLAFMGISEGAIPFALERPSFVIPINVAGGIIGAVVGVSLGAVQWFPESAIWAWPLVEGILPYMAGILAGSLFIAISNVYYRNKMIKKGKITVSE